MDFNVYRRVVEKKAWGILSYIVLLEEWHKARGARFNFNCKCVSIAYQI